MWGRDAGWLGPGGFGQGRDAGPEADPTKAWSRQNLDAGSAIGKRVRPDSVPCLASLQVPEAWTWHLFTHRPAGILGKLRHIAHRWGVGERERARVVGGWSFRAFDPTLKTMRPCFCCQGCCVFLPRVEVCKAGVTRDQILVLPQFCWSLDGISGVLVRRASVSLTLIRSRRVCSRFGPSECGGVASSAPEPGLGHE